MKPTIGRSQITALRPREIVSLRMSVMRRLRDYQPEYISQAPNSIAVLKGMTDHSMLSANHSLATEMLVACSCSSGMKRILLEERFANNPFDLYASPQDYAHFQIVLEYFHDKLAGLRVLQLACNYGPYLHYLSRVEGVEAFGIDLNQAAADYAAKHQVGVLRGSAEQMPFASGSFDYVISRNFLCDNYFIANGRYDAGLIPRVLGEVSRVLCPGGRFISEDEDILPADGLRYFSRADLSFRVLSDPLVIWEK